MTKSKYPKYKSSHIDWIGNIPETWEVVRNRFVMTYKKGKNPAVLSDEKEDNDFLPYLSMDILRGKEDVQVGYAKLENNGVEAKNEDLLLLRDGSNAGEFMKCNQKGILSSTMAKFYISKDFNNQYLYYLSKYFEQTLQAFSIGMGIPHVNGNVLKDLPYFKFDTTEQETIANYLDDKTTKIDEAISLKKNQIELLKEKRTAMINQAVTKGLDPNVEMIDSGIEWIGKINKKRNLLPIKKLVKIKVSDGPHTTPEFVDDDSAIPFVSVESIKDNYIDFNYRRGNISKESHIEFCKKCHPQRDDILLVKSGSTTGKVGIVNVDFEFSIRSPLALIRVKEDKILAKFLFYSIQSQIFQNQVQLFWSFGTQPNIGMGIIEKLTVAVPSIYEQEKIIFHIEKEINSIDGIISTIQHSIDLLVEYKQSLISHVVTGKMKVF